LAVGSQLHAWLAAIMIAGALPQPLRVKIFPLGFLMHHMIAFSAFVSW
jgi:hypothetical protein